MQIAFDDLRQAFRFAIERQWAEHNPLIILKRPKHQPSTKEPFTEQNIEQMLQNSQGWLFAFLFLGCTSPRRPGELLGLKVGDVDFERAGVHIRRTLGRAATGEERIDKETKTAKSRQFQPLANITMTILKQYLLSRPESKPTNYLFPTAKAAHGTTTISGPESGGRL